MYQQLKKLKYSIDLVKVKNIHEKTKDNKLKIIDIKLNFKDPFKVPKKDASNFVLSSLNLAHKLALNKKEVKGIINCAIDKSLLKKTKLELQNI